MKTLFSYVVDHDYGYAPNPYGGICTLVHCKFGGEYRKRNIVEMAEAKVGDWILGSGGMSSESAGRNDCIIYLMRVDEKLEFSSYMQDSRFVGREDHHIDPVHRNKFALISHHYFYFGKNAISISELPNKIREESLFKKGPGYRRDLPIELLEILIDWFEHNYEIGMHGDPCGKEETTIKLRKCPANSPPSSNYEEVMQGLNLAERNLPLKESPEKNKVGKGCK